MLILFGFTDSLAFNFWTSASALFAIGSVAGLLVVLNDWRLSLPGLALIQYGVGQVLIFRYGVPDQWPMVYFWVTVTCALILALGPIQLRLDSRSDGVGNEYFRGLMVLLVGLIVYSFPLNLSLPIIDVATAQLFLWLLVCGVLTLAVTDEAVNTGIGLLLWLIPIQSLLAILLPLPALITLLGSLSLVLSLVTSYVILAENQAVGSRGLPMTDEHFPPAPRPLLPEVPVDWVQRWWSQSRLLQRLQVIGSRVRRSLS